MPCFLTSDDRRRLYVVEGKLHQSKVQSLLNITTLVKFTLFSSTCSVTCHVFLFLVLNQQFYIN